MLFYSAEQHTLAIQSAALLRHPQGVEVDFERESLVRICGKKRVSVDYFALLRGLSFFYLFKPYFGDCHNKSVNTPGTRSGTLDSEGNSQYSVCFLHFISIVNQFTGNLINSKTILSDSIYTIVTDPCLKI